METRDRFGGKFGPAPNVRFGPFELDLRAGELRKEGSRIRLQEQPFQILKMLLQSPGQVVSREEIRSRLWPGNTVVEFDHSINAAVRRLREALRDSAEKPRYIETVGRRGYRFTGELKQPDPEPEVVEPALADPPSLPMAEDAPVHAPVLPREGVEDPPPRPPGRRAVFGVLAAIAVLAFGALTFTRYRTPPVAAPLQPLMRLDLNLGDTPSDSDHGANAVLSPDGTQLVYVSQSRLFIRRLDGQKATEVAGSLNARAPFFSPDGRWIAFFANGKLRGAPVENGPAVDICEAPLGAVGGGSWGADGYIVAAINYILQRVAVKGGPLKPLTELAKGEIIHRWPQVLEGGKAVMFTSYGSMSGLEDTSIEVITVKDQRRRTLVRGGTWGRYLPSGHLVYVSKGTLYAVPLDLNQLQVTGNPTAVLNEIAYSEAVGAAQIDYSANGTLVYRDSVAGGGLVTMQWIDQSGNTSPILPVPGNYLSPALSADGSNLAFTLAGDIWKYDLKRQAMVRLTFGGGFGNPVWTPDGRCLVFRATGGMFWMEASGAGRPQLLTQSKNPQIPWSFTPDGKVLSLIEIDRKTGADIWTVRVDSGDFGIRASKPELFLGTQFQERAPMFSPDGRWLAYMSNESGSYQVYIDAFPHRGRKRQISTEASGYPTWASKRDELFFWLITPNGQRPLMAVTYRIQGDAFIADQPRIFSTKVAFFGTTRSYDPAPDGKHIAALTSAGGDSGPQDRVVFLLNFFDELRRRAPVTSH